MTGLPVVKVQIPPPRDRWKSWAKLLQRVDTSRKDGYAFKGPWLRRGRLDELPAGALVLLYDEVGSRRYHRPYMQVVRVQPDGWVEAVLQAEEELHDEAVEAGASPLDVAISASALLKRLSRP